MKEDFYCRYLVFSHSIPVYLWKTGGSWPGQRKNSSGMSIERFWEYRSSLGRALSKVVVYASDEESACSDETVC